jgi:3-mercaptopyruvate sulfurtransferase SseA
VALALKRLGAARVRAVAGGVDAWRARDFPMEAVKPEPTGRLTP